jgi:hypothetical protein
VRNKELIQTEQTKEKEEERTEKLVVKILT